MSELKARHIVDVYDDYAINPFGERSQVYLKSEADKVIAEKDARFAELKKERDWLAKDRAQAYNDLEKRAQLNIKQEESNRHHKYKRCLAMARIAQDDWHLHNSFYAMGHREFEKRKCEFYEKWRERWLKIAEQFKEAK